MMTFTKDSALVKIWARNVKPNGKYEREEVPDLSNLREMVFAILDEQYPPAQEQPAPPAEPEQPVEEEPTEPETPEQPPSDSEPEDESPVEPTEPKPSEQE